MLEPSHGEQHFHRKKASPISTAMTSAAVTGSFAKYLEQRRDQTIALYNKEVVATVA
jgi:hypothetical protein